MPKKYDHSLVNFQIVLSIYKLDSQNKNYIYEIKTKGAFLAKKKLHLTHKARVMRLVDR